MYCVYIYMMVVLRSFKRVKMLFLNIGLGWMVWRDFGFSDLNWFGGIFCLFFWIVFGGIGVVWIWLFCIFLILCMIVIFLVLCLEYCFGFFWMGCYLKRVVYYWVLWCNVWDFLMVEDVYFVFIDIMRLLVY